MTTTKTSIMDELIDILGQNIVDNLEKKDLRILKADLKNGVNIKNSPIVKKMHHEMPDKKRKTTINKERKTVIPKKEK